MSICVIDFLGAKWDVRLVTTNVRCDQFTDGTPSYRAIALQQDRGQTDALVWWQPIDTRWW